MSVITDRDIRRMIIETLSGRQAEFDLDGLVDAFLARFGLVDVDDVDRMAYWDLVADFDLARSDG